MSRAPRRREAEGVAGTSAAKIRSEARKVFDVEAAAIQALRSRLGKPFLEAVRLIHACPGKVVVTGMGKSGIICRKIASTLASTGTPSFFLHPAEGLHGDLGVITEGDVCLAVSNSGETSEMVAILPVLKRLGVPLIVVTGKLASTLARAGDAILDVSVDEEACPLGLAPTASTTATLAMGDALAMCLQVVKGFRAADFAKLHPGGSLGRQLLLTVADVMHGGDSVPLVRIDASARDVIVEMTEKRLGATGVMDGRRRLVGIITDGDLRRAMERFPDVMERQARELMSGKPMTIAEDALAAEAIRRMQDGERKISQLFVHGAGKPGTTVGIVHLHDLVEARLA